MLDGITNSSLLNQLCAAQSTPIAVKDRDHRFLYANDAFAELFNLPAEALIGKDDLELGRPKKLVLGDPVSGWPGFWALDDQAMMSGTERTSQEAKPLMPGLYHQDNYHVSRTPLHDAAGNVVCLLVQLQDSMETRELKRRVKSNRTALANTSQELVSALDSTIAHLFACQDTENLLCFLAESAVEHTHACGAHTVQMNETTETMEFVAATGVGAELFKERTHDCTDGVLGQVWQTGAPVLSQCLRDSDPGHEWAPGTQCLSLPLFVSGKIKAVLSVVSGSNECDLTKLQATLERMTAMASIAMTNTLLIDSTAKSLSRTRALGEVSALLTKVDSSADALDVVCQAVLPAMSATRISIYLLVDTGTLQTHTNWGMDNGKVLQAPILPGELQSGLITHWCVANGQAASISRHDDDPRESAAAHALRKRMDIGTTYCVPLYNRGEVSGAVSVSRRRDRRDFDQYDIEVFTAIVNQLSTVLERQELATELKHQAYHDRLTALPNRHRFELELIDAIDTAKASDSAISVVFIDLDGFKVVNDTLGHAAGDALLSVVSKRFSACLKPTDVLARMGGDEFALILRGDHSAAAASDIAQRMLDSLSLPFDIAGETVNVSASIGVSQYPKDGSTGEDVLRCADIAMYQSKHSGKRKILFYDESLATQARERNVLESQLRQALENAEFRLVYQPQVRCSDNKVVAVEALIRWDHPTRGTVSPAEFIPVAESIGIVNTIGAWVIDESVKQLSVWRDTPMSGLRVSVNVAASQIQLDNFTDQVFDALERHDVSAHLLELEITERVVMSDIEMVAERLNQLRDAGVRVAIDDFGIGYSSLSYLQDLPLDVLKIDRAFVSRLVGDCDQQSLVKTIQHLATGLGLETVAEGVESIEQKYAVEELGCNLIQGYLHSRPVAPEQLQKAVKDIQSRPNLETLLHKAA
jgi:diguanylate cyclase (GGDEF)-like protein